MRGPAASRQNLTARQFGIECHHVRYEFSWLFLSAIFTWGGRRRRPGPASLSICMEMSEATPPDPSSPSGPDPLPASTTSPPTPDASEAAEQKPKDPAHAAAEEVLDPISAELMRLLPLADGGPLTIQQIA